MAIRSAVIRAVVPEGEESPSEPLAQEALLDAVFFALADPVRRSILERLGDESLLVSELAAPFDISLQAVSRHIQVLVRAGLVRQARTGRISRCSIEVAPIFAAAVWINRYSKYWQAQFDALAGWLRGMEQESPRGKRVKSASGSSGRRTNRRSR